MLAIIIVELLHAMQAPVSDVDLLTEKRMKNWSSASWLLWSCLIVLVSFFWQGGNRFFWCAVMMQEGCREPRVDVRC